MLSPMQPTLKYYSLPWYFRSISSAPITTLCSRTWYPMKSSGGPMSGEMCSWGYAQRRSRGSSGALTLSTIFSNRLFAFVLRLDSLSLSISQPYLPKPTHCRGRDFCRTQRHGSKMIRMMAIVQLLQKDAAPGSRPVWSIYWKTYANHRVA